jgi:PAS domain S-box-containing protein
MTDNKDLRQKAERLALEKAPLESIESLSPAEVRQMLHELRVHQIELEMQNEELRAAQDALDISHARYLDLYDFAPVGYLTLSEQGIVLKANLTAATLLGELRSNLIKRPISGFILKEDQDIYYRHRKRLFDSGDPQECELRMVKKDGASFWAHLTATATQYDGEPVCRIVMINLTERKLAEEVLLVSRWRLESIIEGTHVGTWEWNVQTGKTVFDKTWAQIIGYTLEELEPITIKTWEAFVHPDDLKISGELLERHFAGELLYYDCECRMRHKDGHWVEVHDRGKVVTWTPDGKPQMMFGAHQDITLRKQMEAKIAYLQKAESLDRMAGAIAHHFNNHLHVVTGNLELVLNDLPVDAKNRENLLQSLMAVQKAAAVSRQMLLYLGQTPGRHEPLDLSETCRQSLSLLQAAIPKGMTLTVDFPDSGPVILADPGQIQQVLANLITNARESFSGNPGTISLAVRTVTREDIPALKRFPIDWQPKSIPHACLEVSDTGCGISHQDIEKLFDPFFTTKFTGRGMGLAVIRGIVKTHGGCITVDSQPGYGSVFRVFLPVSTEKISPPLDQEKPAAALARKIETGGTVLLIEDEEMVRNMAKTMLTRFGYTVIEAQDGVEAVEIYQQHRNEICCILSDLTMPRMDGWETLTALRKIRADVPVVLASGHSKDVVLAGEHPELPQAFLYKPYSMSALKEALAKAMGL